MQKYKSKQKANDDDQEMSSLLERARITIHISNYEPMTFAFSCPSLLPNRKNLKLLSKKNFQFSFK